MIHLDTHVVAWLYAGRTDILASAARQAIEEHELRVSPMGTRDPFDRIVVAQARARGVGLVSKDGTIAQHYRKVVWD